MKRRIVYWVFDPQVCIPLVCSLWTLRKWCREPVWVYAFPNSIDAVRRIAEDKRLGIKAVPRPSVDFPGDRILLDRMHLVRDIRGADVVLFLDVDTTFHGPLYPLFDAAARCGFVATQFGNWIISKSRVRSRLRKLKKYLDDIEPGLIDKLTMEEEWPALNGGVWACRPGSEALRLWIEWMELVKRGNIPDERALNAIQGKLVPEGKMAVIEGGLYNYSTLHCRRRKGGWPKGVVIAHYVNRTYGRPSGYMAGVRRWWPIYQECLRLNIGNVRDWKDEYPDSNYVTKIEQDEELCRQL